MSARARVSLRHIALQRPLALLLRPTTFLRSAKSARETPCGIHGWQGSPSTKPIFFLVSREASTGGGVGGGGGGRGGEGGGGEFVFCFSMGGGGDLGYCRQSAIYLMPTLPSSALGPHDLHCACGGPDALCLIRDSRSRLARLAPGGMLPWRSGTIRPAEVVAQLVSQALSLHRCAPVIKGSSFRPALSPRMTLVLADQ